MNATLVRNLALAGAFSAGVAVATVVTYAQGAVAPTPIPPRVLAGADVGFRVEGMKGATPTGNLVVRINGEWVEVDFTGGMKRLSK